jgi:hypothetical protein
MYSTYVSVAVKMWQKCIRQKIFTMPAMLSRLNSIKMVRDYDLEPVRSVYDYPFEALLHVLNVNDVVERELTSVGRDF